MSAEILDQLHTMIRADLWRDVADHPPDQIRMSSACALAAQLQISGAFTLRDGTFTSQACAFIIATDDLLSEIEAFGGFERIGNSLLAKIYREAASIADAMVDAIAQDGL